MDLFGIEKVDSRTSEKSILDENNELKKQLLSLQRNLEEKDKRISILEIQLKDQTKLFSNNHASTQVKKSSGYKILTFILDMNTILPCVDDLVSWAVCICAKFIENCDF